MTLKKKEVEKIAHLSRLMLHEADVELYTQELNEILHFVEKINNSDTQHIEPLAHPLDLPQRLRADVVSEPDLRTKFQAHSPCVEAGLYLVPKVIEEA